MSITLFDFSRTSSQPASPPKSDGRSTLLLGIAVPVVGAIGVVGGAWLNAYATRQGQKADTQGKMVGFAIDVLKSDCKSTPGLVPARRWAVDVLSHYATDVPIDEAAKEALTHNAVRSEVLTTADGKTLTTDDGKALLAGDPMSGCSAPP